MTAICHICVIGNMVHFVPSDAHLNRWNLLISYCPRDSIASPDYVYID